MPRPQKRPPQTRQALPAVTDWKGHPVVVAAGTAVGTVLLCIAVVTQVVIPTQTARLEIEVLKLKDSTKSLESDLRIQKGIVAIKDREIKALKGQVKSSEASSARLETELLQTRAGDLLAAGNPYPIGLGQVRIGMSVDQIEKHFSASQIKTDVDNPGAIDVAIKTHPFEEVTYLFSPKEKDKGIRAVAYRLNYRHKYGDDFLQRKIVEAFGEPTSHPKPSYFQWNVDKKTNIYKLDSNGYMVIAADKVPLLWPDE